MPTATPFHVFIEHERFWKSSLGIFIVIALVLAAGVLLGLVAQKGGLTSVLEKLFVNFTDMLAYWVVILAFVGIFVLGYVVLSWDHSADTTKYVFAAILPLLGTWVGTVLAHYFQKENLAAATKSISDMAKTVGNPGTLASLAAKDFMIPSGKIITLPPALQGQPDNAIPLRDIVTHLKTNQKDRLPLFAENKGSGAAKCVVHLSNIEKYLADKAVSAAAGLDLTTLKLADLILLPDGQLAPMFKSSFSLIKESATLADAKAAMDSMTSAPGVAGNCYDIFVTATGSASEPVLGWITNDIINENAKV